MDKLQILDEPIQTTAYQDLWRTFKPGIDVIPINGEPATAGSAALLRYEPGATVPEHLHKDVEYIFVLSGSQVDENGHHKAGSLVVNDKDTIHSVISHEGCIVLAIWCGNLEMLKN